jgi:hypothetical protein
MQWSMKSVDGSANAVDSVPINPHTHKPRRRQAQSGDERSPVYTNRISAERLRTFCGNLLGLNRFGLRGRVGHVENHVVEDGGKGAIVETGEIRHAEIIVLPLDRDVAVHPVKDGHCQLPASLGRRYVMRWVHGERRRETRLALALGSVADHAIGLKDGGTGRIRRGGGLIRQDARQCADRADRGGRAEQTHRGPTPSVHFSETPKITDTEQW